MDKYVAIALNDLHGWEVKEETSYRPARDYVLWLAHAHALAETLSATSPQVVRADADEMAYFRHGRRVEHQGRQ